MNNLIEILKGGYGYDHTAEDGTVKRTLVPPNKYMIQAATELVRMHEILQRLNTAVEQERAINALLHDECNQYRATIAKLTKELENATARNVSADSSNSTSS